MRAASFRWTDAAVRRALGLEDMLEPEEVEFEGVSTDTRTLAPGELFIALRGPRFDGHAFLHEAERRGAAGAVVASDHEGAYGIRTYPVPDTLVALGQLARFRRRTLTGRVVAITGSSGKTTVKELLRTVLRVGHRVHATAANLNNRIGVPLTLLEAQEDAEFVVVELGTSERGEIEALTRITEPDVAVITTVAESHLEGLGDLEGVMEEKLALLLHLRPGAAALVGDVPPELPERARRLHEGVRVAGFSDLADPPFRGRAEPVDQSGIVPFRFQGVLVRPGLPGAHGAFNTLLALATARLLGVGVADSGDGPLVEAVGAVRPGALRGEQRRVGRMTLVLDCYNANPQSVRAALELLASLPSRGARVAVLGSMLELGERSLALHREILGEARSLPIDIILAVGRFAEALEVEKAETADATDRAPGVAGEAPEGPEVLIAHEVEEAWERLRPRLGGDETVLLKASRGVALERLIPRFESDFAGKGG